LTGSPEKIRAVAQAYKVFYEKVPVPGATEYTIDHTAFTYLIDREGKYVGIYPPGTHYDRLARMLRDEIAVATPGTAR
jgi:protein SCO1/2